MKDIRDSLSVLAKHKFTLSKILSASRDAIAKAKTAPVKAGASRGSYVPKTEPHYEEENIRYQCPTCKRVYEGRNDIKASDLRCQYDNTPLKPVYQNANTAARDGDDREVPRHEQVKVKAKVQKADVPIPDGVKNPDIYLEGLEFAKTGQPHIKAMDYIKTTYGDSPKNSEGSDFMKGYRVAVGR